MSELMNIIKSRRSTRAFKPELPPVEQIRRIVEAAEWAPSGMGRYNWHFSVVYNPEKTLKLARAIAEADNRGPEYNFYGAPVIINISCERDDRNALLNGAAAIENLMLAATELGLGSCWINQVRDQCDVPAVRALLTEYGTPEDHIVTCPAAIGYTVYYYAHDMEMAQGLKLLSIDGTAPSPDTIRSGEYPFLNPYYAVMDKDEAEDSPARILYDWLLGEEGQSLVAQEGYVSILEQEG